MTFLRLNTCSDWWICGYFLTLLLRFFLSSWCLVPHFPKDRTGQRSKKLYCSGWMYTVSHSLSHMHADTHILTQACCTYTDCMRTLHRLYFCLTFFLFVKTIIMCFRCLSYEMSKNLFKANIVLLNTSRRLTYTISIDPFLLFHTLTMCIFSQSHALILGLVQFTVNSMKNGAAFRCIWFTPTLSVLLKNHQKVTWLVFANWASAWMIL